MNSNVLQTGTAAAPLSWRQRLVNGRTSQAGKIVRNAGAATLFGSVAVYSLFTGDPPAMATLFAGASAYNVYKLNKRRTAIHYDGRKYARRDKANNIISESTAEAAPAPGLKLSGPGAAAETIPGISLDPDSQIMEPLFRLTERDKENKNPRAGTFFQDRLENIAALPSNTGEAAKRNWETFSDFLKYGRDPYGHKKHDREHAILFMPHAHVDAFYARQVMEKDEKFGNAFPEPASPALEWVPRIRAEDARVLIQKPSVWQRTRRTLAAAGHWVAEIPDKVREAASIPKTYRYSDEPTFRQKISRRLGSVFAFDSARATAAPAPGGLQDFLPETILAASLPARAAITRDPAAEALLDFVPETAGEMAAIPPADHISRVAALKAFYERHKPAKATLRKVFKNAAINGGIGFAARLGLRSIDHFGLATAAAMGSVAAVRMGITDFRQARIAGPDLRRTNWRAFTHIMGNNKMKYAKGFGAAAGASLVGAGIAEAIAHTGLFQSLFSHASSVAPADHAADHISNVVQTHAPDINLPTEHAVRQAAQQATQQTVQHVTDQTAQHAAAAATDTLHAHAQGWADTAHNLANGVNGEPKDLAKAAQIFAEHAAKGNAYAIKNYAYMQYYGFGVEANKEAALDAIRKLGQSWVGGEALLEIK